MPFDPRVVRCDDEFELPPGAMAEEALPEDLPPELADLAMKLQAEAAWLTSVYPAPSGTRDSSSVELPPSRSRARQGVAHSIWSPLAAAIVVIALGSAAWMFQRADLPATAAPDIAVHPPEVTNPSWSGPTFPIRISEDSSPAPEFLWQDATGPELEGLLDLMEDDSLAGSVVSL